MMCGALAPIWNSPLSWRSTDSTAGLTAIEICSFNQHRPADLQSVSMKQPTLVQLRSLRLKALARDHQVVAAMNASISDTPDSLVKELMDTHGWPAHEALCAVKGLQEKALRDTSEQEAA